MTHTSRSGGASASVVQFEPTASSTRHSGSRCSRRVPHFVSIERLRSRQPSFQVRKRAFLCPARGTIRRSPNVQERTTGPGCYSRALCRAGDLARQQGPSPTAIRPLDTAGRIALRIHHRRLVDGRSVSSCRVQRARKPPPIPEVVEASWTNVSDRFFCLHASIPSCFYGLTRPCSRAERERPPA